MRSALFFAGFALSTFAAPIAQPIDSNPGCLNPGSKRNDQVDPRAGTPEACKISHPRAIEGDQRPDGLNVKREPIYKSNGRREADEEVDVEDIASRAIRNQGSKREPGAVRGGKDHKRSDEEDGDVEARAIRNQVSKRDAEADHRVRGKNTKREVEASYEDLQLEAETANELDARFGRGSHPRSAEPELFSLASAGRRSAEPFSRGSHPRRSAEPFSRGSHPRRSAEAEPAVRGSNKREPQPFPKGSYPPRAASAEPFTRANVHG